MTSPRSISCALGWAGRSARGWVGRYFLHEEAARGAPGPPFDPTKSKLARRGGQASGYQTQFRHAWRMVGCAALLLVPVGAAEELRVGRAKVRITPPIGSVVGNSYEAEAARIGTVLAAAVLKAMPGLQPIADSPLRAATRAVRAPARPAGSAADVARAREVVVRHGKGPAFLEVIHAWRLIDVSTHAPDGFWPGEVQSIVFGRELAIVGYPGDSFVELGLRMKANSPFALTFVSEQSGSGSIGYVPNEKAYPKGSYEVESARLAPGGGEVLADALTRLLTELFHQR